MAAGKEPAITVDIQRIAPVAWLPSDQVFQRWVRAAFAGANWPDHPPGRLAAMTIRLVGHDEGAALNSAWRHKSGPTNVLAFPGPARHARVAGEAVEYGDLVICVPVVRQEATDQHKDAVSHLAHLVVHGTLHLLGYTHDGETDAASMESLEIRVLAGLDIADPYASQQPAH